MPHTWRRHHPDRAAVRVLGIDPGTAITGYGVVEGAPSSPPRLLECGVIRTHGTDPLPARLRLIHEDIAALLARHQPTVLAVEGLFHARNARTTLVLGHARGVILLAAEQAGTRVVEYSPAVVKKTIVGKGAALKPQVGYMVAQLLRLKAEPRPADAADGVAIALTHLIVAGRPRLDLAAAGAR